MAHFSRVACCSALVLVLACGTFACGTQDSGKLPVTEPGATIAGSGATLPASNAAASTAAAATLPSAKASTAHSDSPAASSAAPQTSAPAPSVIPASVPSAAASSASGVTSSSPTATSSAIPSVAPGNPKPSAGCSSATSLKSGSLNLDVDGTKREYVLKLPDGYDATKPHRLVFTFHGAAFTAQNIADGKASSSDGRVLVDKPFWIGPLADKDVIFIAPQGISGWPNDGGRDVKFVKALLALFKSQLCLDETRLFAMGFSFGGIMTIRTGCELAAEFRAIAPMSGSLYDGGATTEATAKSCPGPEHPIAYWSSHGTDDATISPKNGKAARDVFVKWNHCKPDTMPATPDGCVKYNGCDAGYPVTWCDFKGVHEPAPFAPEEIWKFFAQF